MPSHTLARASTNTHPSATASSGPLVINPKATVSPSRSPGQMALFGTDCAVSWGLPSVASCGTQAAGPLFPNYILALKWDPESRGPGYDNYRQEIWG